MGRMFEILKQTESDGPAAPPTIPFNEPALAPRVVSPAQRDPIPDPGPDDDDDNDDGGDDDEVPYIEVGPRRSMQASASVLATAPPPTNLPKVDLGVTPPAPVAEAVVPPSVVFRPVPTEVLRRRRNSQFATELIAFHEPDHAVSGQYLDLFTTLAAALPAGRSQALLFTSALAAAPATDVLLNVAITAARLGRRRIVVLDANLKKAGVAQRFGLSDVTGLRQVLAGAVALDEALQKTEQDNLFALTAGVENLGGTLRFVAETMRSVVRQLRQRYDLVFVDGPPWDGKTEALQAATACDAAYLVLPEHEADSPRVDELFQVIPDKGVRLAGCIFVGR